jgi:hypothetical protein
MCQLIESGRLQQVGLTIWKRESVEDDIKNENLIPGCIEGDRPGEDSEECEQPSL